MTDTEAYEAERERARLLADLDRAKMSSSRTSATNCARGCAVAEWFGAVSL